MGMMESEKGYAKMNTKEGKRAAAILRALNHEVRQRIIKFLEENGRMRVTEIYTNLNLTQSDASQHLAILRLTNIVRQEADSREKYYSFNRARISQIIEFVNNVAGDSAGYN